MSTEGAHLLLALLKDAFRPHHSLMRFSRMEEQRQPFYPIWELFVRAVSQRFAQRCLDSPRIATLTPGQKKQVTLLTKDVEYHPFNLSNREVNLNRARYLLGMLEGWRELDPASSGKRPDWWPRNPTDLIQRVKKEREEVDRLGYVASTQRKGVARSGGQDGREDGSSLSKGKRKRG